MKKTGFTLIELLAVIVILGIISLIVTPMILGVIETAKEGVAKSSASGYIDAIEKQVMINQLDAIKEDIQDGTYDVPMTGISVKGQAPSTGWVVITKGQVTNYSFVIGEYVLTYGEETVKGDTPTTKPEGGDGVTNILPAGLTKGTSVYINPETKTVCNEVDAISTTGTKTGCMKWYVYKDNGDGTYQLILDHNTTALVAWNSNNSNSSMNEVATSLATDTSTWKSSLGARLITADEIAEITGNTTFSEATSPISEYFYFDTNATTESTTCKYGNISGCQYGWLYDRTRTDCEIYGCLNNADETMTGYGYWTSTPASGGTYSAWFVDRYGRLNGNYVTRADSGVRPVITA